MTTSPPRTLSPATKKSLKQLTRWAGFEVRRYDPAAIDQHRQRRLLFDRLGVNVVLDVGANVGQYAGTHLRHWTGYAGRIESFEPVMASHRACAAAAHDDNLWTVHQFGLSDRDGAATINIPDGASDLSSLLAFTARGRHMTSEAAVTQEQVTLHRLDDLFEQLAEPGSRVALKLDVQGYEAAVLRGAEHSLSQVVLIECELPLAPLYEGSDSFADLVTLITGMDFSPIGMWTNYIDRSTGAALDADAFFVRAGTGL
jgi:FkbM family methyltransferase